MKFFGIRKAYFIPIFILPLLWFWTYLLEGIQILQLKPININFCNFWYETVITFLPYYFCFILAVLHDIQYLSSPTKRGRLSSCIWHLGFFPNDARKNCPFDGKRPPGSKYRSTSGLSPREHLERQAEFHASTQDEAWLSCPKSSGTLRSESEVRGTLRFRSPIGNNNHFERQN